MVFKVDCLLQCDAVLFVDRYQRFGGTCSLHVQGEDIDCSLVPPIYKTTRCHITEDTAVKKNSILVLVLWVMTQHILVLNFRRFGETYLRYRVPPKLSLCLTNSVLHHEGVWGSGGIDPHFLDLGTSWRWVVSFTPLPHYSQGTASSTHWVGGWLGPRVGLNTAQKKESCSAGRAVQPMTRLYTDWADTLSAERISTTFCIFANWGIWYAKCVLNCEVFVEELLDLS
jgi:hypothetical protein